MRIGVVGYSAAKFDVEKARLLITVGMEYLTKKAFPTDIEIVSGLTNLGIPALAYEYAERRGYTTVGIACKKAFDYDCYLVDKQQIVGKDWGDESEAFLNYIDCLLRVGGGKQSLAEVERFKKLRPDAIVLELELPETK